MTSSIQSETNQSGLDSIVCQGGIDINELKPWNHIAKESEIQNIPLKGACSPLDKIIQSLTNFESGMHLELPGISNQNTGDSAETTGVGKKAGGVVGSQVGGYVGEYSGAAVGGYFGGPIGAAVGGYVGEAAGSYVGEQIGE